MVEAVETKRSNIRAWGGTAQTLKQTASSLPATSDLDYEDTISEKNLAYSVRSEMTTVTR
jgi:hypothetical protein